MPIDTELLKRKLVVFKSLRHVVQEDARKKTGEASEAVRRAAQVEGICAKIEAEIQEGNVIVAKVQCKCGYLVRIRTLPDENNPRHEYGWVLHTHNAGCCRKLEVERKGGQGAKIVGKCDGEQVKVLVEYEE